MKILLVNKFHYFHGGSETYHFALADLLKNAGHEVSFFSMKDEHNFPCPQEEFFVPNVNYAGKQSVFRQLLAGAKLIYSFDARRRIRKLIKKEQPDIAHVNLVHRQLTFSVIDELYKNKIPVVYTIHDYICICPNYYMLSNGNTCERCVQTNNFFHCVKNSCVKKSKLKSLLAFFEALFLEKTKRYDKISLYIAPSNFIYEKHSNSQFTKSPIKFFRNFLPIETVYHAEIKYDGYLLFFGRLLAEKGVLTLLSAMLKVPERIKLHIAGEGELLPEVETFIIENSLQQRVSLLGFQNKEKMFTVVSGCKAVVVPSEWYENCPYSIMEAQAQGKPIIGSDIGGIPELIDDSKTGYVFKPSDVNSLSRVIVRLYELDEKDYQAMCMKTVENAQREYDCGRYYERIIAEYRNLLETKT